MEKILYEEYATEAESEKIRNVNRSGEQNINGLYISFASKGQAWYRDPGKKKVSKRKL